MVVELDDLVPRRRADRPNLLVTLTVDTPQRRFDAMTASRVKGWHSGYERKLRTDLAPTTVFASKDTAKKAYLRLLNKLQSMGYTVNRDTRVWSVYVIELDPAGTKKPGKGYVYVGETSLTPRERFAQHKSGARNEHGRLYSSPVHKHGVRLSTKLSPKTKYFDAASAKAAEKRLAQRLRDRGYIVEGGH